MTGTAQWFSPLGGCLGRCGKKATGTLKGYRNQDLGPYCEKCANREIKASHKKGRFEPDAYVDEAGV